MSTTDIAPALSKLTRKLVKHIEWLSSAGGHKLSSANPLPLLNYRDAIDIFLEQRRSDLLQPILEDDDLLRSLTGPDRYQRHVLHHCPAYEIVLIVWLPGQQTSMHGHPAGGCLFRVLKGSLQEEFVPPHRHAPLVQTWHDHDFFSYIDDELGMHRMTCTSTSESSDADERFLDITVSLHIYSPPFSTSVVKSITTPSPIS